MGAGAGRERTGSASTALGCDRIVMVDWSASSRPVTGVDSIWIADVGSTAAVELVNHPTRADALDHLTGLIETAAGERLVLGIDVPLGVPVGAAAAVGNDASWRAWWDEVEALVIDRPDNANNRFEVAAELNRRLAAARQTHTSDGPFWGGGRAASAAGIGSRKPASFDFQEYRHCERILRDQGHRPFSVWQLAYPGSVGSQALLAIPILAQLRRRFDSRVRIWPFEFEGFDVPSDAVIIAEVWPSLWQLDLRGHPIRDAAQVLEVGQMLRNRPEMLEHCLMVPMQLDIEQHAGRLVVAEEGWILGVEADGCVDSGWQQRAEVD